MVLTIRICLIIKSFSSLRSFPWFSQGYFVYYFNYRVKTFTLQFSLSRMYLFRSVCFCPLNNSLFFYFVVNFLAIVDGLRNPHFTRDILILCYRTWLPTDRDELVIWLWTLGTSRRLLIKLAAITDGQKFDFGVFTETNKKIYIHPAIYACTHINLRLFLCFFCSFF